MSTRRARSSLVGATLIATALAVAPATARGQSACDAVRNFEVLWQTFDRHYALFGPKHIDWDALHRVYAARVTTVQSCTALFDVLSDLLSHLNDHHVFLFDPERRRIRRSGDVEPEDTSTFSLPLVRAAYLQRPRTVYSGKVTYGRVADRIGYIHLSEFARGDSTMAAIDAILRELAPLAAFVIDVRNNSGGTDRTAQLLASRFADRRRLYLTSQILNGTGHSDFEAMRLWHVAPVGRPFTAPVALLTNRHTMSAAENFTLAMRALPTVTTIGERTAGVFADIYTDTLPNGWQFAVPYTLHLDHDGVSWEGVGLVPDLRVRNAPTEVSAGTDAALELAIELLARSALPGDRGDPATLAGARTILPELLLEAGLHSDVAGMTAARRRWVSVDSIYPGTEADYRDAARVMAEAGRTTEAETLLEWSVDAFPSAWRALFALGQLAVDRGDKRAAATAFSGAIRALLSKEHLNASERRWVERIRAAARQSAMTPGNKKGQAPVGEPALQR